MRAMPSLEAMPSSTSAWRERARLARAAPRERELVRRDELRGGEQVGDELRELVQRERRSRGRAELPGARAAERRNLEVPVAHRCEVVAGGVMPIPRTSYRQPRRDALAPPGGAETGLPSPFAGRRRPRSSTRWTCRCTSARR